MGGGERREDGISGEWGEGGGRMGLVVSGGGRMGLVVSGGRGEEGGWDKW